MTVRLKLLVILLFVALVPLGVAAVSILGVHQRALEEQVVELQRHAAHDGASRAETHFDRIGRLVTRLSGQSIAWSTLTPVERTGALWLIYQELEESIAVTLVEQETGNTVATAYSDETFDERARGDKLALTAAAVASLQRHAPKTGREGRVAVGEPFRVEGLEPPAIIVATPIRGADLMWTLQVTISLASLCDQLRERLSPHPQRSLIDGAHRIVCAVGSQSSLSAVGDPLHQGLNEGALIIRYRIEGKEMIGAIATTALGWTVLSAQPAATAFATGDRIRLLTVIFLLATALVALVAGSQLAKDITDPIDKLVRAAQDIAAGKFGHRLELTGGDELARLGAAFDRMGEEIKARDQEIGAWNSELQQRVRDRTGELQEAYAHLERTQRIAAMTRLGTGLAIEINNPLTSVLGIVQLLHHRASQQSPVGRDVHLLEQATQEALRIRATMKQLLALSQHLREEDMSEVGFEQLLDSALR